ncbi:DUF418 domain-containing protein [Lysobacter sp. CFH 32150]|uniref:DUF418 domain-containing protein n=1 Tax=Lysobacter sp. CFH 32150 TaxID=2927128 RepID=UPI001FA6F31A|nr:DUF418 domain-containing protein [Lysobacter sp. CFH 32150]MCI4569382.1 DUF418 domain-containing protein [Lysobacter sp. CFH 32150]
MHSELAPISARERIEVMDVLRGFALLGILLMNIEAFVGPVFEALGGVNPRFQGADRWVDTAIYVLVQGKFFTLFSLLFGMGFAVMLERANAAGAGGTALYARRLLALLGIGLVHAILIWSGDILLTYALIGFVLLLFFRRTPVSRLPKWGIALYLLPMLLTWGWAIGVTMAQQDPQAAAEMQKGMAEQGKQIAAMAEAERQAYGAGTYLQAVAQRAADTGAMLSFIFFGGGLFLAMFLFGAWFVRSGVIRDTSAHLPLFRHLRNVGLGLGLPLMLWSTWRHPTMSFSEMNLGIALAQSAALLANLLMCMGYFSVIVLAMQQPAWARRLHWLAPAGRMALTNYLMQSVICTAIFYGYGLGYFEQLPRAWQPLFVVVVFALQVMYSRWWLSRYRYGPMEWLWRWLTYRKRPAMRLAPA